MKKSLFILLEVLSTYLVFAQSFSWVKTISNGYSSSDRGCQTVDQAGNVYLIRQFTYPVDLDPGPGDFTVTKTGGINNMYIVKLTRDGEFVWGKQIGCVPNRYGQVYPFSVKLDKYNNIFIAGESDGEIDFDPGTGIELVSTNPSHNSFILKLSNDGNFVWVNYFLGNVRAKGIDVDGNGNVGICGNFSSPTNFNPRGGGYFLSPAIYNNPDAFIVKLDPSGNFKWAERFGNSSLEYGNSLAFSKDGQIIFTGSFEGTVDFDPGNGIYELNAASDDMFVVKLDEIGNFVWAGKIGGTADDVGWSVVTDDFQNIYIAGTCTNLVDFDPGPGIYNISSKGYYDGFVLKLNSNGQFIWARRFGGSDEDNAYSIAVDNRMNVYVCGDFTGSANLNPSGGTFNVQAGSSFNRSGYVIKLSSDGSFLFASDIKALTSNSRSLVYSVMVDPVNDLLLMGYFGGTVDFAPGSETYQLIDETKTSTFTLKLSQGINCTWTGAVSSAWENNANWSCGVVPGVNANVIIGSNKTIIINSNVTINSLFLGSGTSIKLNNGYRLNVIH